MPETGEDEMNVDMKLLAEQKKILLETIWDIEEQDRRYKLWGIVELIDHLQDNYEKTGAAL